MRFAHLGAKKVAVFILIGSDGKEYGPASAPVVKQWIADGRATLETLGRRVGEEAWRRLIEFPELQRREPISDVPPPKLPQREAPAASEKAPAAVVPAVGPATVDPRAYAAELIGRAGKLRIGHCVGRAWRLMTAHFWPIVGGTFIALVVLMVVQVVPILGPIAGMFLSGVLYGGLYRYYLQHARGDTPDLGVVFSGFSAAFVPLMLGSLVSTLLTTLGLILLILPGIYLAVGYTFTFLLIQDRKLEFWCAMEVSRRVITAQWWRMFGLVIVAGFLACLGVIGLLVGIFVTLPILFGAIVYAYEDLINPPGTLAVSGPPSELPALPSSNSPA